VKDDLCNEILSKMFLVDELPRDNVLI